MRTNKYSDTDLQRRSDLATSLKYGAKATAPPTAEGTYAENIPFPKELAPMPQPISPGAEARCFAPPRPM